jgi:hypothetical protein
VGLLHVVASHWVGHVRSADAIFVMTTQPFDSYASTTATNWRSAHRGGGLVESPETKAQNSACIPLPPTTQPCDVRTARARAAGF